MGWRPLRNWRGRLLRSSIEYRVSSIESRVQDSRFKTQDPRSEIRDPSSFILYPSSFPFSVIHSNLASCWTVLTSWIGEFAFFLARLRFLRPAVVEQRRSRISALRAKSPGLCSIPAETLFETPIFPLLTDLLRPFPTLRARISCTTFRPRISLFKPKFLRAA